MNTHRKHPIAALVAVAVVAALAAVTLAWDHLVNTGHPTAALILDGATAVLALVAILVAAVVTERRGRTTQR